MSSLRGETDAAMRARLAVDLTAALAAIDGDALGEEGRRALLLARLRCTRVEKLCG